PFLGTPELQYLFPGGSPHVHVGDGFCDCARVSANMGKDSGIRRRWNPNRIPVYRKEPLHVGPVGGQRSRLPDRSKDLPRSLRSADQRSVSSLGLTAIKCSLIAAPLDG